MKSAKTLLLALVVAGTFSCVSVNTELGRDMIDIDQQYTIFPDVVFPLTDIDIRMSDSLSGYSSTRIVVGSIRDAEYGLTSRASAFTLVPALDTLDFGTNPEVVRFRFHTATDTICVNKERDRYILQNVNVYALTDTIKNVGTNSEPPHGSQSIIIGTPVHNGTDSLAFDFTKEFAKKYIDGIKELSDRNHVIDSDFSKYIAKLPGIYVTMDEPAGMGGRINFFELSCLTAYSGSYYRNNNEAVLQIRSTYNGVKKDTSFLFLIGEPDFIDERTYVKNNSKFPQYAFNHTSHGTAALKGKAGVYIPVEGGGGLKPVFSAKEMKDLVSAHIAANGGDPKKTIINKATIELPFEEPADYLDYEFIPGIMSPTVWINSTFASLADANASSENQGNINRSLSMFSPDITHHLHEIIRLDDGDDTEKYDLWFLILHEETEETSSGLSEEESEYYQQMMYANYYQSLYGDYGGYGYGGYGYGGYGYGGYGYGGYGYGNYYTMMMMQNMYDSIYSNKTSSSVSLDKDRFYKVKLYGPANDPSASLTERKVPKLRVTYSLPKE